MINNLINYAYALFSSIENNNDKQKIFLQNIELINTILSLKETLLFIRKNSYNKKMIKNFFKEICIELKIDIYVIYWLWVIIDNSDLNHFKKIYQTSKKYYFSLNKFISIDVFSSFTLLKQDVNMIDSFFKKLLKKKIILNIHHDPNLFCGIKIKFLNKTYDNSIKAKLSVLRNKLLIPNNECE